MDRRGEVALEQEVVRVVEPLGEVVPRAVPAPSGVRIAGDDEGLLDHVEVDPKALGAPLTRALPSMKNVKPSRSSTYSSPSR